MCTAAAATAAALSRLLTPDHHADYHRNRYDKDKRCYYGSHIIDKECHMFHLLFSWSFNGYKHSTWVFKEGSK